MGITETIIKAAGIENKNKNYKKLKTKREREIQEEIAEHLFVLGDTSRIIINLFDKPVYLNDFESLNPNIRATYGKYSICYISKHDKNFRKYHYCIHQDLIHSSIYVANYRHWLSLCSRIPELAWLNRNSFLNKELFDLAGANCGLRIPFTVDHVRYAKKIMEQAQKEKREKDLGNHVFINFGCSKDYIEQYKDLKLVDKPSKYDIINKIKEADKEYESNNK